MTPETFIIALVGAALYRARGMGLWALPRPAWQLIFALPYGLAALALDPTAALIVLALTTGAVTTGHASYIDLGSVKPGAANMPADGQADEWYGAWIPWRGTYLHDLLGLSVSGLLITAPAGIALLLAGHWAQGAMVAFSGALKALAYVPRGLIPDRLLKDKLWLCEPLCGALLWGSLVAIGI